MIRAIILDLDGTLIDKREKISARVGQAVGNVSREVPISIATGREPADAVKFARQLGLTSPQICDGGATILDPGGGQHLWSVPLGPEQAEAIVNQIHRMKAAFIATHPGSISSTSRRCKLS